MGFLVYLGVVQPQPEATCRMWRSASPVLVKVKVCSRLGLREMDIVSNLCSRISNFIAGRFFTATTAVVSTTIFLPCAKAGQKRDVAIINNTSIRMRGYYSMFTSTR